MSAGSVRTIDLPVPEMNTTPLIDVMLVLLVMILLTIPPITHSTKVGMGTGGRVPTTTPLVQRIDIGFLGDIELQGRPVTLAELTAALRARASERADTEIHVKSDGLAPYDSFNHVIAAVKAEGYEKVGLVGNERFG